ncbi:MAG: transposase IS4 family protein [Parcubacteria group bacterium Gr01-1014_18]|nr:MAG: transposase IS4 family protein [Parcubacteria group bacterium Greene0416_36]TSC80096.1 MAG: transposase IS4 family protein [Parcubacteria group bacterium Gr01-1014_18]TSC98614.1 MAG: transposase IS4 family protein [Parcubacteria group bacterium Greene1014_20]TSD06441.1 MAG: transposase IS4 family protein [Parcubacteria group bacterium Greene0714_2]
MINIVGNKTIQMLPMSEEKIFKKIIPEDHPFRKLNEIIDFPSLIAPLQKCYSELGTEGIAIEKGFKALLVQFWEDYSDREMEKALRENMAVRWFCCFGIMEETPDHSYFGKLRKRIGTEQLANIFKKINEILESRGLFGNVFAFIDASSIITKTALWEERDQALKDGEEKLNNANVSRYAADTEAKWGAKSKNKIWFGYKRHEAVDMRYGLVSKLAVTPANVPDFKTVKNICPDQGMVFMDKLYDCHEADFWIKANGCKAATIRKNNNSDKNKDLDRWRSGIRMPFEGTFSKCSKRAKYRGLIKVTFQCFFEGIVHNLKKAVVVLPKLGAFTI